jgi:hypothetical protein
VLIYALTSVNSQGRPYQSASSSAVHWRYTPSSGPAVDSVRDSRKAVVDDGIQRRAPVLAAKAVVNDELEYG